MPSSDLQQQILERKKQPFYKPVSGDWLAKLFEVAPRNWTAIQAQVDGEFRAPSRRMERGWSARAKGQRRAWLLPGRRRVNIRQRVLIEGFLQV